MHSGAIPGLKTPLAYAVGNRCEGPGACSNVCSSVVYLIVFASWKKRARWLPASIAEVAVVVDTFAEVRESDVMNLAEEPRGSK